MEHTVGYTRWKTHECEKIPCENTFTRLACVVCREDKCVKNACSWINTRIGSGSDSGDEIAARPHEVDFLRA